MTRICGIELKSSDAILAVVDQGEDGLAHVDTDPKRIRLANDENTGDVQSFFDTFCNFIRDNRIDQIVIKKRSKRGQMAGGAVSFKLEGLIQLCGNIPVELLSGQSIAAAQRRSPIEVPASLNQYQEQAFLTACVWARK